MIFFCGEQNWSNSENFEIRKGTFGREQVDGLEVNICQQNFVKDKDAIAAATALQGADDDEPVFFFPQYIIIL